MIDLSSESSSFSFSTSPIESARWVLPFAQPPPSSRTKQAALQVANSPPQTTTEALVGLIQPFISSDQRADATGGDVGTKFKVSGSSAMVSDTADPICTVVAEVTMTQ
jgi:hypothetical protein